ncbi:hypothetical protein M408DRAFT_26920 [Serendipita vermifera MAFF 305830]|uniref:Uncharacterized protein n=1 Tax=Serendipita vermifera MAFF 305830 TaxID=933852 RepID=A0A0C2X5S7_SERVB|nr:hypothetical protein M408DRAFT_26920 [Serendipita vermifera MAFF 305830]
MLPPGIWASFPNLRAFGVSPAMYAHQPLPPPFTYPKISLLVNPRGLGLLYSDTPLEVLLENLVGVLRGWRLVEINLLISWDDVVAWNKGNAMVQIRDEFTLSDEFFMVAREKNLRIRDVHRKVMSDEELINQLSVGSEKLLRMRVN